MPPSRRPFPWGALVKALLLALVGLPFTVVGARDFNAGIVPGGPIMFAVGLVLTVVAGAVLVLIAVDFLGESWRSSARRARARQVNVRPQPLTDREWQNLSLLRGLTGDPRPLPQWAHVTLLLAVIFVAFAYVPKGHSGLFFFMLTLSFVTGYFAVRRPLASRRIATPLGILLLVFFLALFAMRWEVIQPGSWYLALAMLPVAELGRCAGGLASRWFGVPVRVLRREWREIDIVEADDYPGTVSFDVRPLRDRVTRSQVRSYRRERPGCVPRVPWSRIVAGDVGAVASGAGIFALSYGLSVELAANEDDRLSQLLGMSAVLSLLVVVFVFFLWFRRRIRAQSTSVADHIRFDRFAEANGLDYEPLPTPNRQLALTRSMNGVVTGAVGVDGVVSGDVAPGDVVPGDVPPGDVPPGDVGSGEAAASNLGPGVTRSGRPVVYGNYELTGGGFAASYFGGIVSIQLETQLPSMMLRNKRGFRLLFAAPLVPNRDQRLSLEGDFDRYFDLYSPKGYERDALYLFTPDVLVRLMDGVEGFDVTTSGRELTLTARREIVTLDPWVWARIAVAINALNDRIAAWERWREDRPISEADLAEGRLISTAGRRLRGGLSLGASLILLYAASFAGLALFANAL